jgi:hypothetical protein
MSVFNRIRCLLGDHRRIAGEPSSSDCSAVQLCERCGKRWHGAQEHNWSEWQYDSNDSCDRSRICVRCKRTDTLTLHNVARCRCSRCNAEVHDWSVHYREDTCSTGRVVSGSGAAYDKWIGEEYEVIATTERTCRSCGQHEQSSDTVRTFVQ